MPNHDTAMDDCLHIRPIRSQIIFFSIMCLQYQITEAAKTGCQGDQILFFCMTQHIQQLLQVDLLLVSCLNESGVFLC